MTCIASDCSRVYINAPRDSYNVTNTNTMTNSNNHHDERDLRTNYANTYSPQDNDVTEDNDNTTTTTHRTIDRSDHSVETNDADTTTTSFQPVVIPFPYGRPQNLGAAAIHYAPLEPAVAAQPARPTEPTANTLPPIEEDLLRVP